MSMSKVEVGMFCLIAVLLVAMAYPAVHAIRKGRAEPAAPAATHPHQWGKWSEPKTSSDWFNGTWFYQSRTCETCGHAEARNVFVSPAGNAK